VSAAIATVRTAGCEWSGDQYDRHAVISPLVKRRLAAILVCDVVGYSRLMGRDDVGTLTRLKRYRQEHLVPAIAAHRGRIFNTAGDSLLAEFASVVDAVRGAIAMQQALLRVNHGIPDEQQIKLRIGVNVGDVINDNGDIFGDGVNIAARLESLCEPGRLCISRSAFEHVRDKVSLPFADLGEQTVKNIARPIGVLELRQQDIATLPDEAAMQRGPIRPPWCRAAGRRLAAALVALTLIVAGAAWWLQRDRAKEPDSAAAGQSGPTLQDRRLSIVVMPFENVSGDPANDVYADAITEDLITDLSRIAKAFVISSNTSFTFKGHSFDVRDVASRLNVQFAVVGTVRRAGEELSISASLVDGQSGRVLWSDRFVRTRMDMYSFQQEVTGRIARRLDLELKQAASEKALRGAPRDLDSQDYALRAWTEIWDKPQSAATNAAGLEYADKALAIDPSNSDALATRSYALARASFSGWAGRPQADLIRDAVAAGERAVALDPNNADGLYALHIALRVAGDLGRAELMVRNAIAINPNHAPSYGASGWLKVLAGKPEESHKFHQQALAISPLDPLRAAWYGQDSVAYSLEGNYTRALQAAEEAAAANPLLSGAILTKPSHLRVWAVARKRWLR
jgi:class 3 adenylate cyclase/TolB-like protein